MVKINRSDFERIYSALVIPFCEDESVNYDALKKLVDFEIESGVEGFYCGGSSGEGLLLSLEERKKILERVIEQVNGRVPVIAHVGTIRTADVVDLARHAQKQGCVAVSMIPPYYYKFSLDEIFTYYEAVTNTLPDLPVIVYNIPQFTGIEFGMKNAKRLLDNPGIAGIKHTSNNLFSMERMATAYPEKIMFNGFDEQFLGALSMGATATIGTTVNVFAPLFLAIRKAFRAGNISVAHELQVDLNRRVEELVDVGIFPATKYACTLRGIDCGNCREPFSKLSDNDKQKVSDTVLRPYPSILKDWI